MSTSLFKPIAQTLVVLALFAAAPSIRAADDAIQLGVSGRASAFPSLAASGRFVVLVWGATTQDGVTDVYAATSRDGGKTFSASVGVNHESGAASFSGEQPPTVALIPRAGDEPAVVVVWTAKGTGGTRLWSARSDDGGKTFTRSSAVPGSDAGGNRGWEAITTTRDGSVVAIWLDHRELSSNRSGGTHTNHGAHEHDPRARNKGGDGVGRAQLSKLMFARLSAPASSRELTGGVCYCCRTAIATDADGGIYAAWRHVYDGNVRDVAFTRSSDGGRSFLPPVRVSSDDWALDGCPENGPSIAVDPARRIHVVWPTLVKGRSPDSETLALFYALSTDGRRFTLRQRIPTEGVPRHPQMVLDSRGQLVVAWDEQIRGTRQVAVARGGAVASTSVGFVRQTISDQRRAQYPTLAPTNDGVVVGWTSGSAGSTAIRVQRLN